MTRRPYFKRLLSRQARGLAWYKTCIRKNEAFGKKKREFDDNLHMNMNFDLVPAKFSSGSRTCLSQLLRLPCQNVSPPQFYALKL